MKRLNLRRWQSLGLILVLVILFQNCSNTGFQTPLESASSAEGLKCYSGGKSYGVGEKINGYAMSSVVSPVVCGNKRTRTCLDSGFFDGSVPVFDSCNQQCLTPDTKLAVNSGSIFIYYTKATGATQADCDAVKVTSVCSASTGLFAPAVPATRYASCLVQGQTCAYTTGVGIAAPTGNLMGATVNGYAAQAATYPNLCGSKVTRTCQTSGQWTGAVPVYTSCTQKCLNPDTNMPVDQGASYSYYTVSSGTQTQCNNAKVTSTCSAGTGLFSPAVSTPHYVTCAIVNPPVISSLSASPNSITSGQSATLSWATSGAGSLSLSGIGSVTGKTSQVVTPTANTTYTLTATNSVGSVTASVSIAVVAATSGNPVVNDPLNPSSTGWTMRLAGWNMDRAYPGSVYDHRMSIHGGSYPYQFKLIQAPAGMQIHTRNGTLQWSVPQTTGIHVVDIEVKDSAGVVFRNKFEIDVTKAGFYFVSPSGLDSNDGSYEKPWKSLDAVAAKTNIPDGFVYLMPGNYTFNQPNIYTGNVKVYMAWQTHASTVDASDKNIARISIGRGVRALFKGIVFKNINQYGFMLNGGSDNVTIRDNKFLDLKRTFIGGNASFVFTSDGGPLDKAVYKNNMLVQNNEMTNIYNGPGITGSHGAGFVLYDAAYAVIEDNNIHDNVANCVQDKDDGRYNVIRNNICKNSASITMLAQYSQENNEVNHNLVIGAPITIGTQLQYIKNIFIHHNTLVGGNVEFRSNSGLAASENFNVNNNIFAPTTSSAAFQTQDASAQDGVFYGGKLKSDNNLALMGASTDPFYNGCVSGTGCTKTILNFAQWLAKGFDKNSIMSTSIKLDANYKIPVPSPYYGKYGRDFDSGGFQ